MSFCEWFICSFLCSLLVAFWVEHFLSFFHFYPVFVSKSESCLANICLHYIFVTILLIFVFWLKSLVNLHLKLLLQGAIYLQHFAICSPHALMHLCHPFHAGQPSFVFNLFFAVKCFNSLLISFCVCIYSIAIFLVAMEITFNILIKSHLEFKSAYPNDIPQLCLYHFQLLMSQNYIFMHCMYKKYVFAIFIS